MSKATLDMKLLSQVVNGLWPYDSEIGHSQSKEDLEKPAPVEEKTASFSFYRQAPEYEEQRNDDISEPIAKLRKFIKDYYVEINPNTGKKQTFEEYIFELIIDVREDLRRGNYFDKEA